MKDEKALELELKIMRLESDLDIVLHLIRSLIMNMGEYVKKEHRDKAKLIDALSTRTNDVNRILSILFEDYEERENERIDRICKQYEKRQKYLM